MVIFNKMRVRLLYENKFVNNSEGEEKDDDPFILQVDYIVPEQAVLITENGRFLLHRLLL